jgi:putative ABC transport system permease protein
MFVRLIFESFRFAWNALITNPLRTILSLSGVTIGIFAIIAVLTVVDSLERSIKNSFDFLGAGVIYVEKWPFIGSPDFPWWKYMKRPDASYEEFRFLEQNLNNHNGIAIFSIVGNRTIKRENNSVAGINLFGITYDHIRIFELNFSSGRYFTNQEVDNGRNVAIIGHLAKDKLFGTENALGEEIKIRGLKYIVVGVMDEEGESLLDTPSNDNNILIPYESFRKLYRTGGSRFGVPSRIGVKGLDSDAGLVNLENELRGLMRSKRALKPAEEDNFELNRPEAIANEIGKVFNVLTIAGWIIGGFSILVGAFGIANIMFVSVTERTSVIGIQKSLGAKDYFVLLQFLFESIFLSVLGGGAGLLLVYLITFLPTGSLELILSVKNVIIGIGVSGIVGVLSGIIPAWSAARLDPVIAIRAS